MTHLFTAPSPCLSCFAHVVISCPAHPQWTLLDITRLRLHWGKTQTLSTFSFGKCKELTDSGFPQRHTQEALLKPRLNPTLLCPALHATIHLEDSLIPWRGCCTLTPQGRSPHSIGRHSNLGSVTQSQGETLYCFLLWNPCRAAGEIQSSAFHTVFIVTFSLPHLASWLLPMKTTQFLLPVESETSLYLPHVWEGESVLHNIDQLCAMAAFISVFFKQGLLFRLSWQAY